MQWLGVQLGELLVKELHRPGSPPLRDGILPLHRGVRSMRASGTTMKGDMERTRHREMLELTEKGRGGGGGLTS